MLLVPVRDPALEVRVDGVQVPPSVRSPLLLEQVQREILSRFVSSHSKALSTFGWSAYPNRASARAVFPTTHRWLFFALSMENPPSGREKRSIHSVQALAIRGSAFVSPRSARIRSIQFEE